VLTRDIAQFYLPPTRLSTYGKNHPAFTPQPQSSTALWPVLISRPAEGRRLSWPGRLCEILRWFAGPKTVTHPSISRGGRESNSQPSSHKFNDQLDYRANSNTCIDHARNDNNSAGIDSGPTAARLSCSLLVLWLDSTMYKISSKSFNSGSTITIKFPISSTL